ncbi:MAG: hypothetical protein H6598_09885 [Flavobacteriales bacterium]|nr:hypothetical protein [Flavobacteriales bacterium]
MNVNRGEIDALINLVDDEDESIFFQIREKILSYGSSAIPFLEEAWETKKLGINFQERIEDIIHEIQFKDVKIGLKSWIDNGGKDLLNGVLLVNKHQYPDMDVMKVRTQIMDIAKTIRSTFHENMSVQQKVSAMNKGLYAHYGFSGDNDTYYSPKNSLISDVIERKKGNPLLMSILYIEIAKYLDLHIVGINLPRHFVVAVKSDKIEFYLSPFNRGTMLLEADLRSYLSKLNLPKDDQFLAECSNIDIVKRVLLNLINSYLKEKNKTKEIEIAELYELFR